MSGVGELVSARVGGLASLSYTRQKKIVNQHKEGNIMSNDTEQCKKLHKLHDRLTEEVRTLEADLRLEEHEGVGNPTEMVNIIKSLQRTLSMVDVELAKCPDTD